MITAVPRLVKLWKGSSTCLNYLIWHMVLPCGYMEKCLRGPSLMQSDTCIRSCGRCLQSPAPFLQILVSAWLGRIQWDSRLKSLRIIQYWWLARRRSHLKKKRESQVCNRYLTDDETKEKGEIHIQIQEICVVTCRRQKKYRYQGKLVYRLESRLLNGWKLTLIVKHNTLWLVVFQS